VNLAQHIFSGTFTLAFCFITWRMGVKYGRVRGFVDGWWACNAYRDGKEFETPNIPGAK